MVRAILDGRKTQHRIQVNLPVIGINMGCEIAGNELAGEINSGCYWNSKLGKPGDRLWVRETCYATKSTPHGIRAVAYPADNEIKIIEYADQHIEKWETLFNYCNAVAEQVPSTLMPRWVSRITLEITDIRVERLHAITLGDICKEIGCGLYDFIPATHGFLVWEETWKSIHGQDSWQSNPWVWVVEFNRVEAA
ncbi:hypothetical protein HGT70_04590 [Rosenbergiella collisarenosi]|uniref:hypothetical protein n=1 Tax=Rosenbergiella collisarenosi TaxID=1544695 RepID=UPI001BDA89E4|nr:hypothetical protein [Rosenbergiella collisarenosi]MBT0720561.1 hypothetical protein [Rosenbergiella collisarenosi]